MPITTSPRAGAVASAVLLVAGLAAVSPPASAAPATLSGTIRDLGGAADDDAVVIVEQQLPAGARGAAFDDADGLWYDSVGELLPTDGITPGHYSVDLEPGVYRVTAVDDLGTGAPQVFERVVDLRGGSVLLDPTLGDALDCPTQPALQANSSREGVPVSVVVAAFTPPAYPTRVTYQWYRQDPGDPNPASAYTRIDGARASTYTPTSADVGHRVAVDVSGVSEHGNVTCQSTDSGIMVAAPSGGAVFNPTHFGHGVLRPLGVPRVGRRLRAPALVGAPATTRAAYQWYREGTDKHPGTKPIRGARSTSYRPRRSDVGARVYVTITLTDPAYPTRVISSQEVRIRR